MKQVLHNDDDNMVPNVSLSNYLIKCKIMDKTEINGISSHDLSLESLHLKKIHHVPIILPVVVVFVWIQAFFLLWHAVICWLIFMLKLQKDYVCQRQSRNVKSASSVQEIDTREFQSRNNLIFVWNSFNQSLLCVSSRNDDERCIEMHTDETTNL